MPFDRANPPADNRWGVGYTVEKTPITTSGWADAAPEKNRVFKMYDLGSYSPLIAVPIPTN